MARRSSYGRGGMGGYRGRSRTTTILWRLILVLLVVLAVLVGVYLWLQPHMIQGEDGSLILRFPSHTAGPESSAPVTETTAPEESTLPEETPEPVTPANGPLHGVEVTVEDLVAGNAAARMEEVGGNAVVLTMKDSSGRLAYVSQLELAQEIGSSGADLQVNEAIRQLHAQGIYLVAKVECFRDDILPMKETDTALRTNSGYRWIDAQDAHWVTPTDETVQNYLKDICRELSDLGFDEIVLTAATYPEEGHLEYLKVGPAYPTDEEGGLAKVLDRFYEEVSVAMAGTETKVSVETTQSVLVNGQSENNGQNVEVLASHAWRIWAVLEGDSTGLEATLVQAGMNQPGQGLVAEGADAAQRTEDGHWTA